LRIHAITSLFTIAIFMIFCNRTHLFWLGVSVASRLIDASVCIRSAAYPKRLDSCRCILLFATLSGWIVGDVMTSYSRLIPVVSTVQLDLEISGAAMDALLLLSKQSGRLVEDLATDILMQHVRLTESSIA